MNEQLIHLIEKYKKTQWKNLLREDLGSHNLKEIKPYLDFIKTFTDSIIKSPDKLSSNQQNIFKDLLEQFIVCREKINSHSDTSQNQGIINLIVQFRNWILDHGRDLQWALKVQDTTGTTLLNQPQSEHPTLSNNEDIQVTKNTVKKLEKEFKKFQNQYAEQTVKAEATRYGEFFKKEATKNHRHSCYYGGALVVLSVFAGIFAYCYMKFDQDIGANNLPELFIKGDVINKVFIFSIILLIISVLRREYLALKHQYTVNTHRSNAIDSHKDILNSIKSTNNESDREISNAMLLELTKAIFGPQETGLVKDQKNTSSDSKVVEIYKSFFHKSKN